MKKIIQLMLGIIALPFVVVGAVALWLCALTLFGLDDDDTPPNTL